MDKNLNRYIFTDAIIDYSSSEGWQIYGPTATDSSRTKEAGG